MSVASSAVGSFVGATTPALINYMVPQTPAGDQLDRLARAQIQLAQPPTDLSWGAKFGFALVGAVGAGAIIYALTKPNRKLQKRGSKNAPAT